LTSKLVASALDNGIIFAYTQPLLLECVRGKMVGMPKEGAFILEREIKKDTAAGGLLRTTSS
jgi:hypothetical protein